jgi:hypothetical protein
VPASETEKSNKNNDEVPREDNWTYECQSGSCKRKFYSDKSKPRVTFLSCVHSCTNYAKIWPKVESANVEKSAKSFKLSKLEFVINTSFQPVEELLNKAVKIFLDDLKKLKGRQTESDAISDSLKISFEVTESDEISLSMDTDECYDLSISVGIDLKNFYT